MRDIASLALTRQDRHSVEDYLGYDVRFYRRRSDIWVEPVCISLRMTDLGFVSPTQLLSSPQKSVEY